jgi:hypothetical protein
MAAAKRDTAPSLLSISACALFVAINPLRKKIRRRFRGVTRANSKAFAGLLEAIDEVDAADFDKDFPKEGCPIGGLVGCVGPKRVPWF